MRSCRRSARRRKSRILELQQAAETARAALETKKKQVDGMSSLSLFCLLVEFVEVRSRLNLRFRFQTCGRLLGRRQRGQRCCRWPTTSLNRS
jgi:hypothetical protein